MSKQDLSRHAKALSESGASKGGYARAEKLNPEERKEIARKAAEARWSIPKATHSGTLELSVKVSIPCYVLEGGQRILSTRGIMKSLKRTWRGRKYAGTRLPVFLEANNLKPFIPSDLGPVLEPCIFRTDKGARSEGFRAEILPAVCETYLRAGDAGKLTPVQATVHKQCEILVRALSRIGIIALVDEATGYQEVRDRKALQAILEKYITDEWAKWTKTFPDQFYRELFRLKEVPYPVGSSSKRPSYVGHWTNNVVYSRLAPGVLAELRKKNPRNQTGRRSRKHFQFLTRDYGHPELTHHLSNVIFLMKGCRDWKEFIPLLNKAAPKYGDTMPLDF